MFEKAQKYLNDFFGYSSFRKNQKPVVKSILSHKDTLAILPTGGGKSICYQIPALCFDGITIVISPLISLMKDQVDTLNSIGINSAFINSSMSRSEISLTLKNMFLGKFKLIYIAPERLCSKEFINTVMKTNISQIAIDEAHCISQWGHDFRPSYKSIPQFIATLPKRPIITAFTATATKEVKNDISTLLCLKNPNVFLSSFNRDNLSINCLKPPDKLDYLKKYVSLNKSLCGIIYASTRKEVNNIYSYLSDIGACCGRYHAGLLEGERQIMQDDFLQGKLNIMVATNAFGMGIDKSNVRYVIHYNMPKNIESYYQEIGRAGRDGLKSECILLFSPKDISINKYLINIGCKNEGTKKLEYKKLQQMINLINHNGCLRKYILSYFGEESNLSSCGNCSNCKPKNTSVFKILFKILFSIKRILKGSKI